MMTSPLLFPSASAPVPPAPDGLRVERVDTASILVGRVMIYRIHAPQSFFVLGASRTGVELVGQLPPLPLKGVLEITRLIRRITRQHTHLARFPVGTPQQSLTEAELDAWEATIAPSMVSPVYAPAGPVAVQPGPTPPPTTDGPLSPAKRF